MKTLLHLTIATFLINITSFAQVFDYTGNKTFTRFGYSADSSYTGTLTIDPATGRAGFTGSGNIPAVNWTYSSTRPSTQLVVLDPGQPAHFPFPATPPTYGTSTITDVLTVHFSAPSVNYALNTPEGSPTPLGGNLYELGGVTATYPIKIGYDFTVKANDSVLSTGTGSYTILAVVKNDLTLDITGYPVSVALGFETMTGQPSADPATYYLNFITPRTSWSIAVVPEPATYGLIASSGLLAFAISTRKKVN